MAIKKINPTSPGQRGMTKSDFSELTASAPHKPLVKALKRTAGRNNTGRTNPPRRYSTYSARRSNPG